METVNKQKNWLEIVIIPITIVVVTSIVTLYLADQQRISEEERTKADLAVKYTEILLNNYENIEDENIERMLSIAANTMAELDLSGGEEFQLLVNANKVITSELEKLNSIIPDGIEIFFSEEIKKLGYEEKDSFEEDCQNSSEKSECLIFNDGYVWKVNDSILFREERNEKEKIISVATGIDGLYFHIMGTNLIKKIPSQEIGISHNVSSQPSIEKLNKPPLARLEGPSNIPVNYEISFNARGSSDQDDGKIAQFLWTFGDGATGSGLEVTHQYSEPDKYQVTLVVVDEEGLSSAVSQTVNVLSDNFTQQENLLENQRYVTIPVKASDPECKEMSDCFFPSMITINIGETVTWVNEDDVVHTVSSGTVSKGLDGKFESGLFNSNESFSYAFRENGNYHYFCLIHPWMEGTVTVE